MVSADAAASVGKLDKLLEHGRKTVWNPAQDVDWAASSKALEKLSAGDRQALRSVLSLVYYSDSQGREILTSMCRGLDRDPGSREHPLAEKAHEFFVQQMDDEHRHATGLLLLLDRMRFELEPRAFSHRFLSRFLVADRLFDAKLVLLYWYIEVLAKEIFVELKKKFPETYVDSLFTRIIRDEARHVGFGEVFIPTHVATTQKLKRPQMATAYYATAAALPGLFRVSHYARAGARLGLDLRGMFSNGMNDITDKALRLPARQRFLDLKRPSIWASALL
ncbi:MAG: hypothetical protein HY074_02340 [Deltaproteobacteria bacterium]|nr:hypothetical protein [Deltaproteobacteria bacterium]